MLTLANFLLPSTEKVALGLGSSNDQKLSPVKELESLNSETVVKSVREQISEALDISFAGIMLRAWRDYGEVRKALRENAAKPSETVLVPLVEHTIELSQDPSISITRGGVTLFKMSLSVSLEILVEGLILKVHGGRVEEVEAGRFTASGTLKYKGFTLSEKKLEPLNLPGKFLIGPKDQADADQETAEPVLES